MNRIPDTLGPARGATTRDASLDGSSASARRPRVPMFSRRVRGALKLGAVLVVVLPAAAMAGVQGTGGSAVFDAAGPAGFKIEGKTSDVSVAEGDGNVTVTVGLANLDTGIDLRNHHMREKYLEVPKYPNAVLTVPKGSIQFPKDGQDTSATTQGTMTIHGVSKPVSVTYKAHGSHDSYDVSGTTHIKIPDFGINVPSYLGITVKPDVDISVHFVAHNG